LRFRSDKRIEQWKIYKKAKIEWIKERIALDGYLRCEWAGDGLRCRHRANIYPHHKWGREGKLLYDKEFFMAICPAHHHVIHFVDPRQAYDLGYLILRSLRKDEPPN